jgi:hypothetical protein
MGISNKLLSNIKKWGLIDWIINLRFLGYAIILIHAWMKMDISKEEYIGYGAVILLMERVSKTKNKK